MKNDSNTTRLEIIFDVVSEKAISGKIPILHRFFLIPYIWKKIPWSVVQPLFLHSHHKKPFKVSLINDYTENLNVTEIFFKF